MCVCVRVAMLLQMFMCSYMSESVFICKCHNKSFETCLSLFCVHTSVSVSQMENFSKWQTANRPSCSPTGDLVESVICQWNGRVCLFPFDV